MSRKALGLPPPPLFVSRFYPDLPATPEQLSHLFDHPRCPLGLVLRRTSQLGQEVICLIG